MNGMKCFCLTFFASLLIALFTYESITHFFKLMVWFVLSF